MLLLSRCWSLGGRGLEWLPPSGSFLLCTWFNTLGTQR